MSLAAVCSYCRSAVARKGVQVELIGKIPDLVTTKTALALGDTGTLGGAGFRLVGRLQLNQGAAAWDEWYVSYSDGADGWLAEAQGVLLATRRASADGLPAFDRLAPGGRADLPDLPPMTVQEVGTATFVSAEGELPFTPSLGATYRFADLSGPRGSFATLDYGESDRDPELFSGRRTDYKSAGLDAAIRDRQTSPAVAQAEGSALACPNCGAPIDLRRKESATAVCPSCRSLLDVASGALQIVGELHKRTEPLIPLGAKGTLRGLPVEVLGYLRRFVKIDGQVYEWSEWQLWSERGYRYLSESAGHFLFLEPIAAGEVSRGAKGRAAIYQGVRYAHFQTASARYRDLQGELSWQARATDVVQVLDFTAPPRALSCEQEKSEVNWSAGEHLEAPELWKALSLTGAPPRPTGVGLAQPNPFAARARAANLSSLVGLLALIALAMILEVVLPKQRAADLTVPLVADGVVLSEPFELTGDSQAVQIVASAPMEQSWAGLDFALINEASGEARTFSLEVSHFEGVDDGERWREGSRTAKATLAAVAGGTWLIRAEVTLDAASPHPPPAAAQVEVIRGVFTYTPFFLALLALLPAPLWYRFRKSAFERDRWSESDHDTSGGDE